MRPPLKQMHVLQEKRLGEGLGPNGKEPGSATTSENQRNEEGGGGFQVREPKPPTPFTTSAPALTSNISETSRRRGASWVCKYLWGV